MTNVSDNVSLPTLLLINCQTSHQTMPTYGLSLAKGFVSEIDTNPRIIDEVTHLLIDSSYT